MTNRPNRKQQPPARYPRITTASGRRLACYPAAVLAFIVDAWDRFLLLCKPGCTGWEVISGWLEPGESVTDAVLREVRKEAGPEVVAFSLGVLDTFTFLFDSHHPPLISICCLLRYRGGAIEPGDDAKDTEFRWWQLSELDDIELVVPRGRWDLLNRAVDLSRYLRDAATPEAENPSLFL